MASPDGLGWPEEPAGFSLRGGTGRVGASRRRGSGWPASRPEPRQAPRTGAATDSCRGGPEQDTARPARGVSRTAAAGQGQVFREGDRGSRRSGSSKRCRRQFHVKRMRGTQRTGRGTGKWHSEDTGKARRSAGALLEQRSAAAGQGRGPVGSAARWLPAPAKPDAASMAPPGRRPAAGNLVPAQARAIVGRRRSRRGGRACSSQMPAVAPAGAPSPGPAAVSPAQAALAALGETEREWPRPPVLPQ